MKDFIPSWNETWVDRLKQNLLAKYDKFSRPTQHWNTTTVEIKLEVHTVEVDDRSNVMMANLWVIMIWNDDKLKWNSSEYNNLKSLKLGAHEVWLPDLYLLNSATHGMEYYGDRHCIVDESGEVIWVTPTIFHGYCHLDFTYWPYETNTCKLSLSSWTYDGTEVNLKLSGNGIDLESYMAITEWVIKNVSASRREEVLDCCPETYITLDFEFILSRSSDLYYHIVFIPTIPIIFLILITFWLHPQSEMKLIVNASVFFILVLYLIYFGHKIPPRSDSLPIIVKFYSGCLYQTTISLIICTFVININKLSSYTTVPRSIRRLLLKKIGKYLGLSNIINEIESHKTPFEQEMLESHLVDLSSTSSSTFDITNQLNNNSRITTKSYNKILELEWILLGAAIDRLTFILFIIIFIIMGLLYIPTKKDSYPIDSIPYWHN